METTNMHKSYAVRTRPFIINYPFIITRPHPDLLFNNTALNNKKSKLLFFGFYEKRKQ